MPSWLLAADCNCFPPALRFTIGLGSFGESWLREQAHVAFSVCTDGEDVLSHPLPLHSHSAARSLCAAQWTAAIGKTKDSWQSLSIIRHGTFSSLWSSLNFSESCDLFCVVPHSPPLALPVARLLNTRNSPTTRSCPPGQPIVTTDKLSCTCMCVRSLHPTSCDIPIAPSSS